jgi:hypothetical protein
MVAALEAAVAIPAAYSLEPSSLISSFLAAL